MKFFTHITFTLLLIQFVNSSAFAQSMNCHFSNNNGHVTITWDTYDDPNVIGYNIKRTLNTNTLGASHAFTQLNTELLTSNSFVDDEELINCVQYGYYAVAVFIDGSTKYGGIYYNSQHVGGEVYHFKGDTYMSHNFKKGSLYVIEEDFNLLGAARLSIDAGVVVKFKEGTKLNSDNKVNLFSSHWTLEPIIFTSYKDDEHGGDTNGDGDLTKPQAGDWNTLQVPVYFYNAYYIPKLIVKYAQTGYTITKAYNDPVFSKWTFEDCINAFEIADNTLENIVLSENDIINCENFLKEENGGNATAINNWFGDGSGPSNITLNPEGKGCSINSSIPFTPYSDIPYLHPYVQNSIADQVFKEDAGEVINIDLNTIFARPINFDYQLGYSVEIEGEAISAKIENNLLIIETLENVNGTNTIHLKANSRSSSYSSAIDYPYFANLSFNVNITPVNDAPSAIQLSNITITENSAIGAEVGTLTASDVDASQTFTYTMAENENFEIVADKLVSKVVFDFETQDNYSVEVTVADQSGLTHKQRFGIQVVDANEAPSTIQLSNTTIAENLAIGTEVGILTASDVDASQTFTYTIAENENFEIVADMLVSKSDLDFETKDSYSVEITVADQGGLTHKQSFTIEITDENEAPSSIQLSNVTIAENSVIGTEIGMLTASDVDAGQTFTYTIAENKNFEISGDKLVSKAALDFETEDSYAVEITVTDQGGLSFKESFSIQITDVNEAPNAIQLSNSSIVENAAVGTEVGLLTASDVDSGQTFSYTIAENENFQIAGDKLVSKTGFDFETLDNYSVEITVTDQGGLSHTQSLSIQVEDKNEAPTAIQLSASSIAENSAIGIEVGTPTTSDVDAAQTFTYTIAENENFEIVADKLVSKVVFDFETQDNYSVEVTVADQSGLTHKQSFDIQISDQNEAPDEIQLSNATIAENSAIGNEVGILTATDQDAVQTLTFTIAENENFEIAGDKLVSKSAFDFETLDNYSVEITVADQGGLTHKQNFNIEITDENEAPSAISLSNATIDENSAIGSEVGILTATDQDAGQTLVFTITENANFELEGDKLVSKSEFDFETQDSYSVEITVTDQGGLTCKQSFDIEISDENEAPSAITLSNVTIAENSAIGSEVGTLTAGDVDANQTFIYTITENENFEIAGDKLVSKVVFDFETLDNYSVEITVADQGDLSYSESFTIQIENANEAPVFTSEAISKGVEAVEYIYTVECMDIDEDAISLLAIEKPEWLSLVDNGDGTCTLSGTPTQGGLFHVILEAKDSEFTVQQEFDIEVEVVTGIEADFTARTVNIYPNPVANELHIDLSNFKGQELSISLYSLTGKLIFKEAHQSIGEEVSICKSLQHLQFGMYLLMIENDGSRKTYKIVKK